MVWQLLHNHHHAKLAPGVVLQRSTALNSRRRVSSSPLSTSWSSQGQYTAC